MPNVSWIGLVVFLSSYFINYATDGAVTHPVWYAVSAWAALVTAVAMLFFEGYPLVNRSRRVVEQ